jgi:2,5-diamino-6-(ribosylamino)-4(3H)-pyrimidinone 5'-phosphate reductase
MKRKRRRPVVVATFAMTVDGKVTTKNLSPVDFTSREDKSHLFRQRALADAVLIGHTSVKRGQTRCPLRVIVSNEGRIDYRLKIFQSGVSPIIIFSTKRMLQKYQRALEKKATLHLSNSKDVDLAGMLETLRKKYRVRTVACEGGPTLFRSLLELGLIDRLNLTITPYMFGGAKAPTLTGVSRKFLPASVHCSLSDMRTVGDECFLTYRIRHQRRRRK